MRTLKKTLCLVLALVMMLGLCAVSASATDFTDDAQINTTFAEAAEVLEGMGVFKGYTDGSFKPKGDITRAEVAAILYRVVTGDVDDLQTGIYKDAEQFTDIDGHWAAGYINYVAIADLVKGRGDDTFDPDNKVTGYEVLAMFLRAIGYGKAGEFEGASWMINTASYAKQLNITRNINTGTLGLPATREMVAEMIFRSILQPQVTYTMLGGYDDDGDVLNNKLPKNPSLGFANFGLTREGDTQDVWGRPYYRWTNGAAKVYATVKATPVVTYTTAVAECDMYDDVKGTTGSSFTAVTYINGIANESSDTINATDTTTRKGAQGRLIEVYENDWASADYIIVYIDTFLAKVEKVTDAKFDKAGHLATPATLYLTVYDARNVDTFKVYVTNSDVNYSYAKDDMLLVNAVCKTTSTEEVQQGSAWDGSYVNVNHLEIVNRATPMTGAQSVVYSDNSRTVGGTKYPSNKEFRHDDTVTAGAPQVGKTNYTWYFDQYGNLIGAFEIVAPNSYGTIKNIQWRNPESASGYALATIVYMDGHEESVIIDSFNDTALTYTTVSSDPVGWNGDLGKFVVSTSLTENGYYEGSWLLKIVKTDDGTVKIYDATRFAISNIYDGGALAASIKPGEPLVDVTTAVTGANNFYINADTKFLVRTVSGSTVTYTPYTDYRSIPEISAATVVNWVPSAANANFAEYVYLKNVTVAGTSSSALVYVKSTSWYYDANTNPVLNDVYVNGQQTTLTFANKTESDKIGAGKVYFVNNINGKVDGSGVKADEVTGTPVLVGTNLYAKLITVNSIDGTVVYDGTNYWDVAQCDVCNKGPVGAYTDIEATNSMVIVYKSNDGSTITSGILTGAYIL